MRERWGLPGSNPKPEIKLLIALVTDPVHTSMALQFDRTIDALMAAAEEYGYVSSYYWLPWALQSGRAKVTEEEGGEDHDHATKSEHEPGLIIFRYVPNDREKPPKAQVIYLFLVGETPTTGIDGVQIRKAFQYQDELANAGTAFSKSTANDPSHLAIIGPTYSSSAASLRQSIETMLMSHPEIKSVSVNGATSTRLAVAQLNWNGTSPEKDGDETPIRKIKYRSFSYDGSYDEQCFLHLLGDSSSEFNPTKVALLIEDGTAFGKDSTNLLVNRLDNQCPTELQEIVISFPREISLLRNAQAKQGGTEAPKPADSAPSPYLHLSLKDSNAYDSVPHLSGENTPLSQEAQLMTIAHQLQRYGAQYIVISSSNILDQLFLAQFLHRACPDARLVFYAGDLLFEREIDNVPFIGTITLTPYPLISTSSSMRNSASMGNSVRRAYPDSNTQAYYNAASYTIWDDDSETDKAMYPAVAGYRNIMEPFLPNLFPPLWVTAIGSDGYYPLGIASPQASGIPQVLLQIKAPTPKTDQPKPPKLPISPERLWCFLCFLASLLCLSHSAALCTADYWSPLTRELAVKENDRPRRRAMFIHIGTAMLFCMTFVLAFPPFAAFRIIQSDKPALILSGLTLAMGVVAVAVTFWKTRKYIGWRSIAIPTPARIRIESSTPQSSPSQVASFGVLLESNVYCFLDLIAWGTLLTVPLLWVYLCSDHESGLVSGTSSVGLFFSFRCIHPGSGVSPVVPVLLLLLSWYLWAVFQTWRLRFSENNRPMVPSRLELGSYSLFVADEDLCECSHVRSACLYRNITCLLITREFLRRFLRALGQGSTKRYGRAIDVALVLVYLAVFVLFVLFVPVRSLDAFLWALKGFPTPYEFLITALFFPLLVITLTGWVRMIFVWGSLKRGLLDRLENLPIRFAFSRLKAAGWMAMLRQGGLQEQWRDMARSTESMRQMINDQELNTHLRKITVSDATTSPNALKTINDELNLNIEALLKHRGGVQPDSSLLQAARNLSNQEDLPAPGDDIDLVLMHAIERKYAAFSEVLLERVLVPYWKAKRSGYVESEDSEGAPTDAHSEEASEEPRSKSSNDPVYIRVAEEFLAIRYLALIRVVLVNMRYLMVFVSLSFVLAIVAWNSYPFQPRQLIDWVFTGMLAVLGCGMISVLAQMHRDPILSRITHTNANELGAEFYVRIIAFGAVPVLTWLAYQFPDVGSTIFKFLQPGLEVVK